jgi:uncharacterized DUF497 family protein
MEVEWDPAKAASNRRKHRVDFTTAATVLQDDLSMMIIDDPEDNEDRFVVVGADFKGRILVVVFTWRSGKVRLVSARRATKHERQTYEERI